MVVNLSNLVKLEPLIFNGSGFQAESDRALQFLAPFLTDSIP